ncbi:hypothetical protein [Herbidospora sp. NBRC 101105]|uniref:hypothetical protein n=1 Tax=Herbidospora sp. NBRC 101105 TaxID=3032195 RepID=UPI0024A59951|nr:hypothetical protein [Herbidospora sp. NBRC 101105]GLX98255.1 hypothetical protein Hesp01_62050 [Herbidospora sp. NBRC 101105]
MSWIDADALWRVMVASLVGGVGIAALFSVGLIGLSSGRTVGRVAGGVCFVIVIAGVLLGVYVMLDK